MDIDRTDSSYEVSVTELEGPDRHRRVRLYRTGSDQRDILVIFFHSGRCNLTTSQAERGMLNSLAATDTGPVVLASGGRTLHRPFPDGIEDGYALLQWACVNQRMLGWRGTCLIVAGVEAGAAIAAAVALMARDRRAPQLCGQILIRPMLDPSLSTGSMRDAAERMPWRGIVCDYAATYQYYLPYPADRMHPYASPLLSSRLKGLPEALILTARDEPLRDESACYAEMLEQAGVTVRYLETPPCLPAELAEGVVATAREELIRELIGFIEQLHSSCIPKKKGKDGK